MEWRDIESAPMDGTWIMLFSNCAAFPTADCTHWIAMYGWYEKDLEYGWIDQDDALVMRKNDPTHWMPLPAPPA